MPDDQKPTTPIELLVEWARKQAALAGNGHIDENERFKLREIVEAIDAAGEPDYANAPISLDQVRADKARDAKLITPRHALVEELRDIDSGDSVPDAIIIFTRIPNGAKWSSGWRYAGLNTLEATGFTSMCLDMLVRASRDGD